MKTCTHCKIAKRKDQFFFKVKKAGKLHSNCKACYALKRAKYMHQHYEKYGDMYRKRARERKTRIKRDLQNKIYAYLKNESCATCGFNDIRALDFDHIDANIKSFGIARGITTGYSWERITE